MYGHVEALARRAAAGVAAVDGVEAVLRRVPETLPPGVLEKMQAPAKDPAVPVIAAAADLEEADGVLFGFPTRYGAMAAQMKAFFDSTGSLWEKQKLAGKPAGFFVSTGTQGGGQETTAWTAITQIVHHGMLFVPIGYTFGSGMFKMDEIRGGSPYGAGVFAGDGSRQPSETELALAEHQGKYMASIGGKPQQQRGEFGRLRFLPRHAGVARRRRRRRGGRSPFRLVSPSRLPPLSKTESMMDTLELASAIPEAGDEAFQIHRLKRSAYAAVLRAFYAQPDLLSGAKEGSLAKLRSEFRIFDTEHREYLMKAISGSQSLSVGLNKASICNIEVTKDSLDLVPMITDAQDTAFQIHCLERSAYASVLRAFFAQSELLSRSQAKLLTELRKKLRISDAELREVLMNVTSNEYIKSLRNCSLANNSGLKDPTFDARAMVPDKLVKDGQSFTSFTNCISLSQESQISPRSMLSVRSVDILRSSHRTKKGPCLYPHAIVPAKKYSGNEYTLSYLKSSPAEQLPVAVSSVQVKRSTDDPLDTKTLPCEVKTGCTLSPIQLKHIQANAGHVPLCIHQDMKASMKRKTEVPEVTGSKSLTVIVSTAGNIEHDFDIMKLDLTANLLSKVEQLFREKPNPDDLETAKAILKEQEKVLLDAVLKLSEVSYVEECFSTNCQPDEFNQHYEYESDDEMPQKTASTNDAETPPKPVSPSDKEAPPQPVPGRGGGATSKGKAKPRDSGRSSGGGSGSGGRLDAADDQPTSASTCTSSSTLSPRSEREGEAKAQRARGRVFEPPAKRARRPSVRLSRSEWLWW
uniref:NAD(P)H dehydrogenase (quinone) n=2 Tax=Oryza TaxID=4527 RepID=A0A0D3HE10_9ORYZ